MRIARLWTHRGHSAGAGSITMRKSQGHPKGLGGSLRKTKDSGVSADIRKRGRTLLAAVAVVLLVIALMMLRTCGPCTGRSEREAADTTVMEPPAKPGLITSRNKRTGRTEPVPIDEDRDIVEEVPNYEGPVDLGTQIEIITK
mgnify:CR=1 FL=1